MPSTRMPRARAAAIVAAAALAAACSPDRGTGPGANLQALCGTSTGLTVSLAPGGVATVTDPAQMACMAVPRSGSAAEYVFIAGNASTLRDAVWRYTVESTGGTPATASVASADLASASPDLVAAGGAPSSLRVPLPRRSAWGIADRLEQRRQALARRLSLSAARALHARRSAPSGVRLSVAAVVPPSVGDLVSYRVPDTVASCDSFFTVGARVRAVSEHAVIAEDTTAPPGGFSDADFTAIASEFDRLIYPTDTTHFGSPGDLDANGRVVILYTPRVNAETPRGSKDGYVAGFFFGGDLFPRSGAPDQSCEQSNVAELFYLLTPDPGGVFSDVRATGDVREATRGTIAHEFQHMINLSTRIRENAPSAEVTWLDEALAHFAEEVVGRAARGYSDMRKLTIADILDVSNGYKDFDAFFAQNAARYQLWRERPDSLGATSGRADVSLEVRGAAWSLVRYAADQYSGGDVAAFTRKLVAGPEIGTLNLERRSGASFAQIVGGWMPAHYTSGLSIPNLPPQAAFQSWNMRNVENAFTRDGSFSPLAVTDLATGAPVAGKAPAAGGSYYRLSLPASSAPVAVRVRASGGAPVSEAGASVFIVRTR